jgi:hypothetical protein
MDRIMAAVDDAAGAARDFTLAVDAIAFPDDLNGLAKGSGNVGADLLIGDRLVAMNMGSINTGIPCRLQHRWSGSVAVISFLWWNQPAVGDNQIASITITPQPQIQSEQVDHCP